MYDVKLIEGLTFDDLQEQHKKIAEILGFENVVKLSQTAGGTSVYIPKPYELGRNLISVNIKAEYDGKNLKDLAIKYKVSESTIYRVVKEDLQKMKIKPLEGQITLI